MDEFFVNLAKTLGLNLVEHPGGFTVSRGNEELLITTDFSDVEEFLDNYSG